MEIASAFPHPEGPDLTVEAFGLWGLWYNRGMAQPSQGTCKLTPVELVDRQRTIELAALGAPLALGVYQATRPGKRANPWPWLLGAAVAWGAVRAIGNQQRTRYAECSPIHKAVIGNVPLPQGYNQYLPAQW